MNASCTLQHAYCLVAEIRLQIYDLLLVRRGARLVVKAAKSRVNPATLGIKSVLYNHDLPHLCGMSRLGRDKYLEYAYDDYECDHQIDKQHLEDPFALPFRCASCRASLYVSGRIGTKQSTDEGDIPSAAILATCKTIANEATSMLYRNNTIEIDLGSSSVGRRCDPAERDIQLLCDNVFILNPDTWSQNVALPFRASVFVAFLNAIGPVNAKEITSLSLTSSEADNVANRLPTITSLVELYLRNLKQLKIRVTGEDIDPIIPGCFDRDHPVPASPWRDFWIYEGFIPLHQRLKKFVRRIVWLQDLKYEGQMVFLYSYIDDQSGYQKLKVLEDVVRRRAQGASESVSLAERLKGMRF